MSGVVAWLMWAVVHLTYLARHSNRESVLLQWLWEGATGQRGSRLILNRRRDPAGNREKLVGREKVGNLLACVFGHQPTVTLPALSIPLPVSRNAFAVRW